MEQNLYMSYFEPNVCPTSIQIEQSQIYMVPLSVNSFPGNHEQCGKHNTSKLFDFFLSTACWAPSIQVLNRLLNEEEN